MTTPIWPNGARCALTLTFDFDAETNWITPDPLSMRRPGRLSQGTYGARVGVPKILEWLSAEELPATFFVPGWVAQFRTERVEAIARSGAEIGHHGYLHKWIAPDDPEGEEEELMRGLEALKAAVGVRPVGYRSPAGETSPNLIALLAREGFLYDSSMMDDINPYRHHPTPHGAGPVELPWHWSLDDAPYMLFGIKSQRPIMPNEHVLSIWTQEFDAIREWGGLINLVMHPQCIGRPSRLKLLADFIAHTRQYNDVWYATCESVARYWAADEPPATTPISPFLTDEALAG